MTGRSNPGELRRTAVRLALSLAQLAVFLSGAYLIRACGSVVAEFAGFATTLLLQLTFIALSTRASIELLGLFRVTIARIWSGATPRQPAAKEAIA